MNTVKHLATFLFAFSFIFTAHTTNSLFAMTACVGQPASVNWSWDANATGCSNVTGSIFACNASVNFTAGSAGSGSKSITIPNGTPSGTFCTASITCQPNSVVKTDTLTYDATTVWNGSGCVAPAPTSASVSITPASGLPDASFSVSWSGNNTPTSFNYRVNGGASNPLPAPPTYSGNYTATSLGWASGSTYTVTVQACNAGGCSGWSAGAPYTVLTPSCANGTTNYSTCTTCPTGNSYWNGSSCTACGNGGCTGCTATTGSPTLGCSCNNGGTPGTCTPPTCGNGATNFPACNTCPTNSSIYWNGSCTGSCSNGGCSGCSASSASPTGGCSCSNGGSNPPTCTPPTCGNGATNFPACNVCPTNSGYYWNGTSCTTCSNGGCYGCSASSASPTGGCSCSNGGNNPGTCTPPSGMSGTLSASPLSCTVSDTQSTCNSSFTWTTSLPEATSQVVGDGGGPSSSATNNSTQSLAARYIDGSSQHLFRLYNNSKQLAVAGVVADCSSSSAWNGTSCQACSNGGCTGHVCNNGANNPPTCNTCPIGNSYWNGTTCTPCGNGGCTGCTATIASPINGCSCINGGNNPGTCTPPAAMSGTLSASSPTCTIGVNGTGCSVDLTWSTTNPIGTSAVTRNNPAGTVFSANGGNAQPTTVSGAYPTVSYYLYNNAVLIGGPVTITPTCTGTTAWNGTSCQTCSNGGCAGNLCINGGNNPPTCTPPSCSNGTTNSPTCTTCPVGNSYFNGTTCTPCGNGGCTGCTATTASPTNGCSCTNGGIPGTCTPPGCLANQYMNGGLGCTGCPVNSSSAPGSTSINQCVCNNGYSGSAGVCTSNQGITMTGTDINGATAGSVVTLQYSVMTNNTYDVYCRLLDNLGAPLPPNDNWTFLGTFTPGPMNQTFQVTLPGSNGTYLYKGTCHDMTNNAMVATADLTVTVGVPLPDLVIVGPNLPVTTQTMMTTNLFSTYQNNGTVSTVGALDRIDINNGPNGTGVSTVQTAAATGNLNPLAPGNTNNTMGAYLFPSVGTYSYRFCVDSNNSIYEGPVGSAAETNNCESTWTNITVTNGGPTPTGTLDATPLSCTIAIGDNSCPISFHWTTTNPVTTSQIVPDANPFDGLSGPTSALANNSTESLQVRRTGPSGQQFWVYNNSLPIAGTNVTVTADCAPTVNWAPIAKKCVSPDVVYFEVTGQQYYSVPLVESLRFQCFDSTHYRITKDGNPWVAKTPLVGGVNSVQVVTPDAGSADYQIFCINETFEKGSLPKNYNSAAPSGTLPTIDSYPKTINSGGKTTISWSITKPRIVAPLCKLVATPVCANGTCTVGETTAVNAIKDRLATESVDGSGANLPTIAHAVSVIATGQAGLPSPKALGKKTLDLKYTTDFTVDCNGTTATTRIRVANSSEK